MPWDSDKSTAVDPDNPNADEQLSADEWDAHVNEGHFPADQLNFGTNGSGNPIATDPQTGDTVLEWDRSAGTWVLPAVSTGKAYFGGGEAFRRVAVQEPSSDQSQIQFSGLSNRTEYRIFYNALVDSGGGDLVMRFNGDGPGTGSYFYYDETGTYQANEDAILLRGLSDNADVAGIINISELRKGESTDRRVGAHHRPMGGWQGSISGHGTLGGLENQDGLSSLELIAPQQFRGGATVVELWERGW